MSRTRSRSLALTITLALGCSARGTFNMVTPSGDASVDDRVAVGPDGTNPDRDVTVPFDLPIGVDRVTPLDVVTPVDVVTGNDVVAPRCGDEVCNGSESCTTCPGDCGKCPASCGNGTCDSGETCMICPRDCGECPPRCGDGTCNGTETCTSCASDCGACAPRCGDGTCNGTETCTSCASDCGACPTDPCERLTSCSTCLASSGCAWCNTTGATACRSSEMLGSCTSPITTASSCPGTVTDITAACPTGAVDGTGRECGWVRGSTLSCTPGSRYVVGCSPPASADAGAATGVCAVRQGSCVDDPILRVCAGSGACAFAARIDPGTGAGTANPSDDACGTCPMATITCPAGGSVTIFTSRYYVSTATGNPGGTCTAAMRAL